MKKFKQMASVVIMSFMLIATTACAADKSTGINFPYEKVKLFLKDKNMKSNPIVNFIGYKVDKNLGTATVYVKTAKLSSPLALTFSLITTDEGKEKWAYFENLGLNFDIAILD